MTTNKASDSNAGVQKVNDKGSTPAQLKYFFLSLPAEVRLKIYDFALDLPMAVVTDQHRYLPGPNTKNGIFWLNISPSFIKMAC